MTNNTMVFYCNICDKNYKSKKSLYVHNHKYHKKITQNNTQTALNSTQTALNSTKKINKINNKKCPFCNLTFTRLYSKNRHMKICKVKNEKEKCIILKMKKEKNKYKDEIKRLKERLRDKMNKSCKMHYKTLQKINNQLNNNITKNN